jgi:hypothetical protein
MDNSTHCYICHDTEVVDNLYANYPLPCECKGSIAIHKSCLKEVTQTTRICSICKNKYKKEYLPSRNGLELIIEKSETSITEYTIDENNIIHGEYTVKTPENILICKSTYDHGILNGEYKCWYLNGQVQSQCICINNKIEGIFKSWHENGILSEYSVYNDGIRNGIIQRWDKAGKIIYESIYANGEEIFEDVI